MKKFHASVAAWAAVAALTSRCATQSGSRRHGAGDVARARVAGAAFPTRDEIARIASATRPTLPPSVRAAPLERWELAGPFPSTVGTRASDDPSPFAALLRAQAAGTGGRVVVSESMQCVARELGRYLDRHEGAVPQPLTNFVMGRCGAQETSVAHSTMTGTAPESATEAEIAARHRDELAPELAQLLDPSRGSQNVGVWFGRDGAHMRLMFVAERRSAALDATPAAPDAEGQVTLRGRLLETAQHVTAQITRGDHDSAQCVFDPAVRLPRFQVRCPVRAGDAVARVEMSATPPGRLLSHVVLSAVVGAGRDASRTFDVMPDEPTRMARDAGQARDALLALVNEVRQRAGVQPVDLAPRQSETACRVTPAFFANSLGDGDATENDRLALGMMAGWDLDAGMIHDGRFITMGGASDNNLARWIEWTLDRPAGRNVLLDRDVRQVALCPWMSEGQLQGILWSSYSLYDDAALPAEVDAVYRRIDEARRARGQGPAERMTSLHATMSSDTRPLTQGHRDLDATLNAMLEHAVHASQRSLRGSAIPTTDLDSIEFPRELVEAPTLRVAVQVVHWRAPDAAWGESVVFLLVG